ncbi:MAG: hypothetical protein JWO92_2447 [Chitinophagaceae bacterium]|nr:hypothetical protein [Chitinophagaceae bacterium]
MLEINNHIELQTNTKSERLTFATRYLVQLNFTFDLTVLSEGFCGTSHFCIRRDEIESFCSKLTNLHSSLSGSARLDDNDSDAFVEFNIESEGQLHVNGQVGGSHEDHYMVFKFQTDQTCIPNFVQDFKSLLLNTNT